MKRGHLTLRKRVVVCGKINVNTGSATPCCGCECKQCSTCQSCEIKTNLEIGRLSLRKDINMGGSNSTADNSPGSENLEVVSTGPSRKRPQTSSNPTKIQGLTKLLTEQNRRKKDTTRDEYDVFKDNMHVLKQLYKRMDPSIMKTATYISHGDIELAFRYEQSDGVLLVQVIRARNLSAKDLRGKSSDPFVKLCLHPYEDHGGIMKTQVHKRTLNPVFHEIFTFPVSEADVMDCKLVVQVWDHDHLSKDDFIGEAVVPLLQFDFMNKPTYSGWFNLQAETDLRITGDLTLTLDYKMPQTLLVTVHKASGLSNKYEFGAPCPFVKLQIPGIAKVFETKKRKEKLDPVWEETFEFLVPPEELSHRHIVFHVIDYDEDGRNDSLGQVIIDLMTFQPGAPFKDTYELADLKNSDRLRSRWFQPAAVQEFRESLISHAAFRYPSLLFRDDHQGTKMVRVTSRKARAMAKVRLIEGIPVY